MPGNQVEDGFHGSFELENFSEGQPLPQVADSLGRQVINKQIGAPSNFNPKYYDAQQLDSLRGHDESKHSTDSYVNRRINRNVFPLANQLFQGMQNQQGLFYESSGYNNQNNLISRGSSVLKFHLDNDSVGSPTLTTNSERSEITEASTDFCFPKRQQENFSILQKGFPKYSPMQQSGCNEMELFQQQVLFKQLQDHQRQQQLQQQNYLNPFSTIHKQGTTSQFSPVVDGMFPKDETQGYINWVQRDALTAQQGTQNRAMFSVGCGPQQLDASLYGTPVGGARATVSQQSPTQVMYQDSVNLLNKPGGQIQKPLMQLSDFTSQYALPQDQVSMPQGAFMSNLGFQGRNIPGMGPVYGLNDGLLSGNLPMRNTQQINASPKNFNGRPEQIHCLEMHQKATQQCQGLVPLDPLEEKILFNTESTNLSDIGSAIFGNTFDNSDHSSAFPSIQSGSWSALMQSAVAEASSSDTGMQEEWSGLTFQNTEPSVDNIQVFNFIDIDKQQTGWVNNSFPSTTFPSIEEQKQSLYQDSTPESIQRSPMGTGHWVDHTPQKKPSMEGNQQIQSHIHLNDSHVSNFSALSNPFQPMVSALDMSRRANWNSVSSPLGKAGISAQFNVQASSVTPSASGPLVRKNEPQMQMMLNAPMAASRSAETTLPSLALETEPGSHSSFISSTSQQVEFHARPYNVWMDLPTRQHPLDQESLKVPCHSSSSVNVLGSSVKTLTKAQQISSEVHNVLQRVDVVEGQEVSAEHISDASTHSNSSHAHSVQPETDDRVLAASERNIASASHSLKPANCSSQSYSTIYQLEATNDTETNVCKRDPKAEMIMEQKLMEHNSRLKKPVDSVMNSTTQVNTFVFNDPKMLNLMSGARKNQNVIALLPNMLPEVPAGGTVGLGQSRSQSQSSNNSNVVFCSTDRGQVGMHETGATWLKQFGTLRNGQMLPLHDSKKTSVGQWPSEEPSPDWHAQAHVKQEDRTAQDVNFRPLDMMNQGTAIIRPKKRKHIIPEQLAWHKEVTQGSQEHQPISFCLHSTETEQEWAQATNRLFEKAEDEAEMIDLYAVPPAKRRLMLTTKLLQQLIRPAPSSFLSADVSLIYDSISYFFARTTLGDACSLTCGFLSPSQKTSMVSKKLNIFERNSQEEYSKVVEGLIEKAKKLESGFQRFGKVASIAEIRLELQDLERFSVINHFARFHNRAQVETSGNPLPSAMPRPVPQRYVTAVPMPRNLPEGAQCLSL